MIKLKDILLEASGRLELLSTDVKSARKFSEEHFRKNGYTLDEVFPNFDKNYKFAQSVARYGKTLRKDMPVISNKDVKQFQHRLKNGYIDIHTPFSDKTNPKNPFPQGLSGQEAEQWLKNGLAMYDHDKNDDIVKVNKTKIEVKKLIPIQKQIYLDSSIYQVAIHGVSTNKQFINNSIFITSSDNRIIDGHHRFLISLLYDLNMKVNVLQIDLPINKLLPMSLSYSDAIGNQRNI